MSGLLSRADLRAKGITYHRQSIWRLVRARRFPPPIKLGSQTLAWWESEINAWLQDRTAERDATYRVAQTAPAPANIKIRRQRLGRALVPKPAATSPPATSNDDEH
jgi:prophage regulatory protein